MGKAPYFQGDSVLLRFKTKGATPTSSTVNIYAPDGREVVHQDKAGVKGQIVSYILMPGNTKQPGDYRGVFTVGLGSMTRTHIVRFHVAQKEPEIEGGTALDHLDPGADSFEAGSAINLAARSLRRAGVMAAEASRIANDAAENITGRRI